MRTPVYPLFIDLCKLFAESYWQWAVCFLQIVVTIVSFFTLGRIAESIIGNRKVSFWICTFYLLWPANICYALTIGTETLSVSGMIFLIWNLIKLNESTKLTKYWILSSALVLVLIFLRPIFIYLPFILAVYGLVIAYRRKLTFRKILFGLIPVIAIFVAVGCYVKEMNRECGIHGLTIISTHNNFYLTREANLLCPELSTDSVITAHLNTFQNTDLHPDIYTQVVEANDLLHTRHYAGYESYVNQVLKNHKDAFIKRMISRFSTEISQQSAFASTTEAFPKFFMKLQALFSFPIPLYFILCLVILVMAIRQWRKYGIMPLYVVTFLAISVGITIVSIIGANSDYGRLMAPGIPAFLLALGEFLSKFSYNKTKQFL